MVFRRNTRVSGNTVGKMSSWDSFASLWSPDALKTAPDPPTVLSPKAFDDNTVWIRSSDVTRITADAVANPVDATVDADNFFFSTATTDKLQLTQYNLDFVEGFEYTFSVYAKGNPDLVANKFLQLSFGTTCFDQDWACFDVFNGDLVEEFGGSSPSGRSKVTDVGGGWYKLEFSLVAKATGTDDIAINIAGSNVYRVTTFIGSSDGYYLWNAQITCSSVLTRWYDSSDSSTITLDGSTVTTWTDKSANAATATQSGATSLKPEYVTGLLNGLAGIRADGVDDYLRETGSFDVTSIQVYCLHRSLDWITDTSKARNLWHTDFGQANLSEGLRMENYSNSQTVRLAPEVSGASVVYNVEGNADNPNFVNLQRVTYARRADTIQTELNSTEVVAATAATSEPASFGSSLSLFVGFSLSGSPARYDYDEMFEFVVFSVPLPTSLADKYEGYVMHKFGSADRLPVGHTYKTQPPYLS